MDTVIKMGVASRAEVGKAGKAAGCGKGPLLKVALQKGVKNGVLEMYGKSYVLGAKARDVMKGGLWDAYEKRLEEAKREREEAAEKKAAGRARAEARYATNYVAAITGPASSWNRGVLGE